MQLSLFDSESNAMDSANALLDALNDRRKKNDVFSPEFHYRKGELIILIAKCKNKIVGNIIDQNGNAPDGLSACWRNVGLIMEDLNTMV